MLNPIDTDWLTFNIIDAKRLANPITFLLIDDKLGPLGNVRCSVGADTVLRNSIYRHEQSACGVPLLNLESCARHSEYVSGTYNHQLDACYYGKRELYTLNVQEVHDFITFTLIALLERLSSSLFALLTCIKYTQSVHLETLTYLLI